MKALIVDDEIDIGLIVSRFLVKSGLDAEYVDSVNQAKVKIKTEKSNYDFYFLDLNLPDGTGFDLIPLIRAMNKTAKIIIISAYDGLAEKHRARGLSVDSFIKKPFTRKDIITTVEALR